MTERAGIPPKFIADYIWIGGDGEFRSKTRVITVQPNQSSVTLKDIPHWNYDGSSTNQADGKDSEIVILPRALYRNPFTMSNDVFVVCDTYTPDMKPHPTNTRAAAYKIFSEHLNLAPWYGMEQEYFIIDPETNLPVGYKHGSSQGAHYCGSGSENVFGRTIADQHMALCIRAGVNISGINAEVAPGQWEFQVGPCEGVQAGDDMLMTGLHETADYSVFSHGIANRGASVRIRNDTYRNKKGYFEDRRPSSNCDPYLVSSLRLKSITS